MEKRTIIYEFNPQRLDYFLSMEMGFSREFIKKMIKTGLIKVNGLTKKPSYTLDDGDKITIKDDFPKKKGLSLKDILIREDEAIAVINKPPSISVHPNDDNWEIDPAALLLEEETVASMIYSYLPKNVALNRLGIVHRLDKGTSGIMLIAKTENAAEYIKEQFEQRKVSKKYIGAVSGIPDKNLDEIDAPIGRPPGNKKHRVWQYGRVALTKFKIIEKGKKFSLLEISPKTGRTNQIRVHLSFAGHPIAGDDLFKGEKAARLMLHSFYISLKHPLSKKKIICKSPIPPDFTEEWERLKLEF